MSERRISAGLLGRWAVANFPNKTAALFKGRRITYLELEEASNRLANALLRLGLSQGDGVAVQLRNSIESMIVP